MKKVFISLLAMVDNYAAQAENVNQQEQALRLRNKARTEAAIEQLGERYLLHPANRQQRSQPKTRAQ